MADLDENTMAHAFRAKAIASGFLSMVDQEFPLDALIGSIIAQSFLITGVASDGYVTQHASDRLQPIVYEKLLKTTVELCQTLRKEMEN